MKSSKILMGLASSLLLAAGAAQAGCNLEMIATLPAKIDNGRVYVSGTMDGHPVDYLVDLATRTTLLKIASERFSIIPDRQGTLDKVATFGEPGPDQFRVEHLPLRVGGTTENFGAPQEAFKNLPLHNKWIYQSNLPTPPLPEVEAQMTAGTDKPPNPFIFRIADMPVRETMSGMVQLADSTNFLVSKTIAATRVTIKPGGLRAMHWHPNADEWLYILKGAGRSTVFNTGPAAISADFHAGDIGLIKKAYGHYLVNTGDTDLVYMEVFRADRFEEVLLSDWLAHSPIDMVAETLNLDRSVIAQFPKNRPDILPA